jgi:hypothetical protein
MEGYSHGRSVVCDDARALSFVELPLAREAAALKEDHEYASSA